MSQDGYRDAETFDICFRYACLCVPLLCLEALLRGLGLSRSAAVVHSTIASPGSGCLEHHTHHSSPGISFGAYPLNGRQSQVTSVCLPFAVSPCGSLRLIGFSTPTSTPTDFVCVSNMIIRWINAPSWSTKLFLLYYTVTCSISCTFRQPTLIHCHPLPRGCRV